MISSARSLLLHGLLFVTVSVWGLQAGEAGAHGLARGVEADRPAAAVALSVALKDAHRLAALKGDKVVRVEGVSMLPYFGDGSVLVVKAARVEALREGMVVLYRNAFGETVAHRVEARAGEGWKVRGANNARTDTTTVTAANLLGTVYATFYSDPRSHDESMRVASVLAGSTEIALAATAR